jgi:NADPH:quinone reductase-like Zn-dependent oxidoreductase
MKYAPSTRNTPPRRWPLGMAPLILSAAFAAACIAAPPQPPAAAPASDELMKAIVYREYGTADVLRLEEIARPVPKDNQVLVKVRAASANPLDWHEMRGTPYLVRIETGFGKPKNIRLGSDMAGEVVAIGKDVTAFKPGDAVFGVTGGAFGEYVRASEKRIALKPATLSWEQAASVPVAAITALQGLRDKGHVAAGTKVLINGASGGVGTFAVQIAKALGAEVTGVCSTRNLELVRSLGADHVIDYTQQDFAAGDQKYDVILDLVGNRALLDLREALTRDGIGVLIGGGGPDNGRWLGAMTGPIKAMFLKPFVSQEISFMLAEVTTVDLGYVAELITAGKVTPVIDRRYALAEVPDAIRYLEEGHARGKVIIDVGSITPAQAGGQ